MDVVAHAPAGIDRRIGLRRDAQCAICDEGGRRIAKGEFGILRLDLRRRATGGELDVDCLVRGALAGPRCCQRGVVAIGGGERLLQRLGLGGEGTASKQQGRERETRTQQTIIGHGPRQ